MLFSEQRAGFVEIRLPDPLGNVGRRHKAVVLGHLVQPDEFNRRVRTAKKFLDVCHG